MAKSLESGTTRKVHCNTCNLQTPHELKGSSRRGKDFLLYEGTELEYSVGSEVHEYRFWACQVCETATLEINYNRYTQDMDEPEDVSTWYPARARLTAMKFHWYKKPSLKIIYKEIIESYNIGLRASCAASLRVLLEGICVDMGIEDDKSTRTLTEKLYALAERGHVKPEIVDQLFALKFIGDKAIHQLKVPTDEELEIGIKVVESLIFFLYKVSEYELSSHARRLAEKHPDEVEKQRQRRARGKHK